MELETFHCVIPSRLAVGEPFRVRLRLLGPVHEVPCEGQWNTTKPQLHSPFNVNVQRGIKYRDNCLPDWTGTLSVEGGPSLQGPATISFDGENQGVFENDTRPIGAFGPYTWSTPGIHFLRVIEPESGLEGWSNPVCVTESVPDLRIFWGDPHWQTFFSDGIRCPEELYTFARDETFLDFGAISDHVEALTDRQWDYFVQVTNDFNQPGRFATLVGQEWTKHNPGHRNVYYRGASGPILRCTDPKYNALDKLWQALETHEAIAIPHHTANKVMGVDWNAGWNPRFEKAVEIYSVWGSSELPEHKGNTRPLRHCQGEVDGRHVQDALNRGYRLGFVGGGDIHDGRPGDSLGYLMPGRGTYPSGLTAVMAPALTREHIYDAIKERRTYATTPSRIYLSTSFAECRPTPMLRVVAASEEGIADVTVMQRDRKPIALTPEADNARALQKCVPVHPLENEDWIYVRVTTMEGNMAWSSPAWDCVRH